MVYALSEEPQGLTLRVFQAWIFVGIRQYPSLT